ncbi:MAG: septal ring lytic transglycosylase RlpA family protein [Prochlorothrix sp.]
MGILRLLSALLLAFVIWVSAAPARAETATVYAGHYNGLPTASGELYSDQKLTAAHPPLPLGTYVRVSRGDQSVVVKINDRCRCAIDLSLAAAKALGFGRSTRQVTVEIVPGPEAQPQLPRPNITIGRLSDGAAAAIELFQ